MNKYTYFFLIGSSSGAARGFEKDLFSPDNLLFGPFASIAWKGCVKLLSKMLEEEEEEVRDLREREREID